MKFSAALETLENLAVQMLTVPGGELAAVAITNKNGGSVVGATDFAVTAFVPKKLTIDELQQENILSFEQIFTMANDNVPPERTEVDLDVVESGSFFSPLSGLSSPAPLRGVYGGTLPTLDTQKHFSSLRTGIGITNPKGNYPNLLSVGTLGFFLQDDSGNQYLVSNNHVIGGSNAANIGDPVVQPGTLDLTNIEFQLMPTLTDLERTLKIAELSAIVKLNYRTNNNIPINKVDAAMAKLTNSDRLLDALNQLAYGGRIVNVAAPYEINPNTGAIEGSARVYKVGRTTGYTEGIVTAVAATSNIPYGNNRAFFNQQIIVQATPDNGNSFSQKGDSGSGVLNERHELVGLLFAGSTQQTLVNPINLVLTELRNTSGNQSLKVIL